MKSSYIYLFLSICCSFLSNMALGQSVSPTNLLMLDYSVYDPFYVEKIENIIEKNLPDVAVNHFWSGSAIELTEELEGMDYVVIPYPSKGNETLLNEYGKSLKTFIEKGGVVVCTGTHEYTYINAYQILDVFYGRYCLAPKVEMGLQNKQFSIGMAPEFVTQNFGYTLDVFDPYFIEVAQHDGRSLAGVKTIGTGAFIYLGLEYFFDEPASNQLLINALQHRRKTHPTMDTFTPVTASALSLVASQVNNEAVGLVKVTNLSPGGSSEPASYDFDFLPSNTDQPSMRVYPNPFTNYTIADIELGKNTNVTIRVLNHLGQLIVTPVSNEVLEPGKYKYKISNLPEGVYFIEYDCNGEKTTKKVMKIARA